MLPEALDCDPVYVRHAIDSGNPYRPVKAAYFKARSFEESAGHGVPRIAGARLPMIYLHP